MKLDPNTINELAEILRPFVESQRERQSFLIAALGNDAPVLQHISWDGSVATFIPHMLDKLANIGGREAFCKVLEHVRSQISVHEDVQQRIDELLNKLQVQDIQSAPTPLPSSSAEEKYREEVKRVVSDNKISDTSRRILNEFKQKLGISQQTAEKIEAEILHPFYEYQKHLDEFLQILVEQIYNQLPFSAKTRSELREIQK
ncbi:hypothetical protein DP116_09415, partial [Brasilonema bromeliae SPC951]|nr:hypothetical protein [Brasilonema bromeliae SPC951]